MAIGIGTKLKVDDKLPIMTITEINQKYGLFTLEGTGFIFKGNNNSYFADLTGVTYDRLNDLLSERLPWYNKPTQFKEGQEVLMVTHYVDEEFNLLKIVIDEVNEEKTKYSTKVHIPFESIAKFQIAAPTVEDIIEGLK